MGRNILSLLFIFVFGILQAQKKIITHADYDLWKQLQETKVSKTGKLILSTVVTATDRGDGYLQIYNTRTGQKANYFNGKNGEITDDEKFVIFTKAPSYQSTRLEKKNKVKSEDQKKEVLYIYDVANHQIYDSIERVKSYKIGEKSNDYFVIEKFRNKKDTPHKDSLPAWKYNYAIVYHLASKKQDTLFNFKEYIVPEKGSVFYYTTLHEKNKKKANAVCAYDAKTHTRKQLDSSLFDYKNLAVNKEGTQVSYIAEYDSVKANSARYKLFLYKNKKLHDLVAKELQYFQEKEEISGNQPLTFSEDGKRLYFYTKLKSEHKKDTTLLDDEIPEVDVWSWNDEKTQPRQKVLSKELDEDTRLYSYDIQNEKIVKLQDGIIDEIVLSDKYASKHVLGIDYSPYATETWKSPWEKDYYVINRETGVKRLLFKQTITQVEISKSGDYGIYFNYTTNDWYSVNLETFEKHNLTEGIEVSFEDEDNDVPAKANFYGLGGYDKKGNILLYDKYDIWSVPVDGAKKAKNITKNGRENKITYRTQRDKDDEWMAQYIDGKLFIVAFDETLKADAIYLLDGKRLRECIAPSNKQISSFVKAKEANVMAYRVGNFNEAYDQYITLNNFKTHQKITNINPQQKDFKWGTSELVSWNAYDGTKLEGIVYKPEDFDPQKKYPMIVYFYERSSHKLNNYVVPKPSASTVNPTYLASNGYILFVPDIVYKAGQPGDDAYNCVISGVEMMEKKGYIDSSRMALQGQSWGGYQVAYLITKTNKFKAAMAGAPVSNMTSAYGGIRWKTGYSRMFQYENTQSRIGKNLWEGFDLYIKNSPLFHLPNVETPLLIMHNDNDGAVPYYQGIELFMGMRRLKKPAWLLVYNNEAHNLRKMKNRQDLSIRMMQFFDHYLKDKPAPVWMTQGVPRAEKGINFGYELDKN